MSGVRIPDALRDLQQWGQVVDPRVNVGRLITCARVSLPPEYDREWTVQLSPAVSPGWEPGPIFVPPGKPTAPITTGLYASITYGNRIPQTRVIDWPMFGGSYGVRGAMVQVDAWIPRRFGNDDVPPSTRPSAVGAEIVDAALIPGHFHRLATFTEANFTILSGAAGAIGTSHRPPLGAIAARLLHVQVDDEIEPPLTQQPFGDVSLIGWNGMWFNYLGVAAKETLWSSWGDQGLGLSAFGDMFEIFPVRVTSNSPVSLVSNYRLQYRIDL